MSDPFWMYFFGFAGIVLVALINGLGVYYLAKLKSGQEQVSKAVVQSDPEGNVKKLATMADVSRVAMVVVKTSEDAKVERAKVAEKVITAADEVKQEVGKVADGVKLGREQMKAEFDAKAVAITEGMRLATRDGGAALVADVPVIEGLGDAVVDALGKKSAENKDDPKKEQVPVTLRKPESPK